MNNKLLLKLHCFFSNLLGALVLIYVGLSYAMIFYELLFQEHIGYIGTIRTLLPLLYIFFLGLLLLGVSQFLRHVSGQTDNPGWILRRGELIIYLAMLVIIVQVIWRLSTLGTGCFGGTCSLTPMTHAKITSIIFSATIVFAILLIMFGIAQSLRRMGYSSSKKSVDSGGSQL